MKDGLTGHEGRVSGGLSVVERLDYLDYLLAGEAAKTKAELAKPNFQQRDGRYGEKSLAALTAERELVRELVTTTPNSEDLLASLAERQRAATEKMRSLRTGADAEDLMAQQRLLEGLLGAFQSDPATVRQQLAEWREQQGSQGLEDPLVLATAAARTQIGTMMQQHGANHPDQQ